MYLSLECVHYVKKYTNVLKMGIWDKARADFYVVLKSLGFSVGE